MPNSIREILEACIEDIDAGRWLCGQLTGVNPKGTGPNFKPLGCAIGLVGINSGAAELQGDTFHLEYPTYDNDQRWTDAGKEAVRILAKVSPMTQAELYDYGYDDLDTDRVADAQEIVVSTNDDFCIVPKEARNWFKKALDSLPVNEP
jgi:hypothetical protein